ncbi:hypothetical protein FB451DRAFT_1190891 [Mycena latifolia]|nr:hypothetical protein FB451DRAFT_1190891 [Mycena latifolia]
MDATATRCFLASNVIWPADKGFFIPKGGLAGFLEDNLRFKLFLVGVAVFTDSYASRVVRSVTTPQYIELRARVKDIVRHMFFAAQIRQNEYRVSYEPAPIPAESAWTFHVILVLLAVVGFEGDNSVVSPDAEPMVPDATEGRVAHAQASFLLGGALQTFMEATRTGESVDLDYTAYDPNRWISKNFAYRDRPTDFPALTTDDSVADSFELNHSIARWREREDGGRSFILSGLLGGAAAPMTTEEAAHAAGFAATVKAARRVISCRSPTRRSIRVLASKIVGSSSSGSDEVTRFCIQEGEQAMSEASSSSVPELLSVSDSSAEDF